MNPSPETSASAADLYIGSVSRLADVLGKELSEVGEFHPVQPDQLPAAYRTLLAHTGHMTVTLEAFHNSLMDVQVLHEAASDASYAREILLSRQSDGGVVQYGLVRIWLGDLPADVVNEIQARETPLGRVLIRHGLLRDVELLSFWQITPSEAVKNHFGITDSQPVYGRSAQILVDGRPTVQLLEIVRA